MTERPDISVVIPTYNRVDQLHRALVALERQTLPSGQFEVVVVSDGSTDGTNDYLARATMPNLVSHVQANAGPAAARNRGVELARAPLVLFVDDDIVAAPDLVARHVHGHAGNAADVVVIGPMLTPEDADLSPWVAWEQAMLAKQYKAMEDGRYEPTFRQFYTGNASVSRARLIAAGGFDQSYRRAEDVEVAFRLHQSGVGFVFDMGARGFHYAERSFAAWISIASDYGANDVLLARQGQSYALSVLPREFRERKAPVRWLVRACISFPAIEQPLRQLLRVGALATHRAGLPRATQLLLSALYGVAYHRGLADQLGGARAFKEAVLRKPGHGAPKQRRFT